MLRWFILLLILLSYCAVRFPTPSRRRPWHGMAIYCLDSRCFRRAGPNSTGRCGSSCTPANSPGGPGTSDLLPGRSQRAVFACRDNLFLPVRGFQRDFPALHQGELGVADLLAHLDFGCDLGGLGNLGDGGVALADFAQLDDAVVAPQIDNLAGDLA